MYHLCFEDNGSTLVAATDSGISVWDCKTGTKLSANSCNCGPLGVVSKVLTLSALVGRGESKTSIAPLATAATSAAASTVSAVAGSTATTGSTVAAADEVTLSPTKILIYNHSSKKLLGELTTRMPILSVKMQKDKIFVVLEDKTYCYDLYNLAKITQIDTVANTLGLCEVVKLPAGATGTDEGTLVVTPGTQLGYIKITRLSASPVSSSPQLRAANAASIATSGKPLTAKETAAVIGGSKSEVIGTPILINAHKSGLSALAINRTGTLVASASKDGTIIRVFDISSTGSTVGTKLHEFRRGKSAVKIHSLAFNQAGNHLLCSSDTGTVHLWSIASTTGSAVSTGDTAGESKRTAAEESKVTVATVAATAAVSNKTSYLSFASAILPKYFSSEWSFCQYHHEPLPKHFPIVTGADKIAMVAVPGTDKRCIARFADELSELSDSSQTSERSGGRIYVAGYDGSFSIVKYSMDGTTEIVHKDRIYNESTSTSSTTTNQ